MATLRLVTPSRRQLIRPAGIGLEVFALPKDAGAREVVARDDLKSVFRDAGVAGTFVAFDAMADRMTLVDRERAARRYIPASTFKIPNTLIAFEAGVVSGPDEMFRHDGKPRAMKTWERDMTLREAITASNVPVYQEIARRVGLERYRSWIDRLGYGNREIGEAVDTFWLKGPLETSAVEQVQFLAMLGQGKLPASARAQALVRDMIRIEAKGPRTLFAKTGWTGKLGWWVGWVEDGSRITSFALNIDMSSVDMAPKRIDLAKELLARIGVY